MAAVGLRVIGQDPGAVFVCSIEVGPDGMPPLSWLGIPDPDVLNRLLGSLTGMDTHEEYG